MAMNTVQFGKHVLNVNPGALGGEACEVSFPNGYGASVIRGPYTYGGRSNLWELGVTKDGSLCYSTEITEDVIGYLTEDAVGELLTRIEALPPAVSAAHTFRPDMGYPGSVRGALTLWPRDIGTHPDGWTVTGEVHEDHFKWVNEFEAVHPTFGRVWGDFEKEVYADSLLGFRDFYDKHPPEDWDYWDI